jgi:hypothetical protein
VDHCRSVFKVVDWSAAQTAFVTAKAAATAGLLAALVAHLMPGTSRQPVAFVATFTAKVSATLALGFGFGSWFLTEQQTSAVAGVVTAVLGVGALCSLAITSRLGPAEHQMIGESRPGRSELTGVPRLQESSCLRCLIAAFFNTRRCWPVDRLMGGAVSRPLRAREQAAANDYACTPVSCSSGKKPFGGGGRLCGGRHRWTPRAAGAGHRPQTRPLVAIDFLRGRRGVACWDALRELHSETTTKRSGLR